MKLTESAIRSLTLPEGKSELIVFDSDVGGFGVRMRAGGSKVFVFQYQFGEKSRRMTLGSVKAIDLGKARDNAKDLYARVRLGQDPQGEKIKSKAQADETFGAVVDLYLAHQQRRLRSKSYVGVKHHLLKHAKPLHRLQLSKIDRKGVALLISTIANNSGLSTSDHVCSSISAMYSWAVDKGLVESNPIVRMKSLQRTKSRQRVLKDEELRVIWKALPNDHYGDILKMLAFTGCRANEIAQLRWSEVHGDVIELPGDRTKNGEPHTVPLAEPANAIVTAQPRRMGPDGRPRDLIFGYGNGGFSGWGACKQRLDQRIAELTGKPLVPWRIHDLRRTAATGMGDIGVPPHVVEACLNHKAGSRAGIAGVYNKSQYERERRPALTQWAEHLMAVIEGRDHTDNVRAFRRLA